MEMSTMNGGKLFSCTGDYKWWLTISIQLPCLGVQYSNSSYGFLFFQEKYILQDFFSIQQQFNLNSIPKLARLYKYVRYPTIFEMSLQFFWLLLFIQYQAYNYYYHAIITIINIFSPRMLTVLWRSFLLRRLLVLTTLSFLKAPGVQVPLLDCSVQMSFHY